jgi:hypothetical protein
LGVHLKKALKVAVAIIIVFACLPLKSLIGQEVFCLLLLLPPIIHLTLRRNDINLQKAIEIILLYFLFFFVGFEGIWGFTGHFFLADQVAKGIGWATGSPFQTEMAFANLSYGVLGFLCIWFRKREFWLATAISTCVLHFGAAYTHLREIIIHHNFSELNTGYMLWINDLTIPIVILILVLIYYSYSKKTLIDSKNK